MWSLTESVQERARIEPKKKYKYGWKAEQIDPKKYTVFLLSTGTVYLSMLQTRVV